ncbi:DoxX protein [Peribacillus muralis]|uniref:DoxX protein n=1 Tax=Peribacillus muralis TaxID=264697 RepID=A0A1B3XKV4_9BACI|nr:DoxX family membrane protein [Peribacillus muralis]AOH53830.1 DoxX protein [Peribacillus muralis]
MQGKQIGWIALYIRLALGVSFLSAVADRFGLWGKPGASNVAWGNMKGFMDYVNVLNPVVPDVFIPTIAWIATIGEIIFGILLILGFQTRIVALLSSLMLLLFALGLTVGVGFKATLDYSVFSASAASLLLVCFRDIPYSLDSLVKKKQRKYSINV